MAVTFQQIEALEVEGRELLLDLLAPERADPRQGPLDPSESPTDPRQGRADPSESPTDPRHDPAGERGPRCAGRSPAALRDRLLGLCYPILDDEIRRISYHYCRSCVRGSDGAWRGEIEYESFYGPLFTYVWEKKFAGANLTRFFGRFAELGGTQPAADEQPRLASWLRRSIRNACLDWFRSPVRSGGRSTGITQAEMLRTESARQRLPDARHLEADRPLAGKPGVKTGTPAAGSPPHDSAANALASHASVSAPASACAAATASGSAADLRSRLERALAQLKPKTRAALYLFYCVALPVPEEVIAWVADSRDESAETVQAEVEALRAPLVQRFAAQHLEADEEILAAQRLRMEDAEGRITDLERAAAALNVSAAHLDQWRMDAAGSSIRAIDAAAQAESSRSRRRVRCEYQKACRALERARRKVDSIETRRAAFPTPTYTQIGDILGLKEAGATAQVHRGRKQLHALLPAGRTTNKGTRR